MAEQQPPVPVRLACPYDPHVMLGQPIGMYHCPVCACMVMAGCVHPPCDPDDCEYGDQRAVKLLEARGMAQAIKVRISEHPEAGGTSVWTPLPRGVCTCWLARHGADLARLVLEATGADPVER